MSRIDEIRQRLDGVRGDKWQYDPNHEMFVGSTNALNTEHGTIDLGRSPKEFVPYLETGTNKTRYRLAEWCGREQARIQALGKFLEQCREDIEYLLGQATPQDINNTDGI